MLRIIADKKNLVLPKGTGLELIYKNPLFNDYGSQSNPIQVSGRGSNKKTFNFPSRLVKEDLQQNEIQALIQYGAFNQYATLKLLRSTPNIFELIMYLQEGAFAALTEGKTLKDVDYGPIIEMGSSAQDVADFVNNTNRDPGTWDAKYYPDINFCFPTLLAPNFYGDENELHPEFSGVLNELHKGYGFIANTIGNPESSPMPAMFAFYMLERIAITFGYQLKGYEVLKDERFNQLIFIHNCTLDELSGENFMHAEQSSVQNILGINSPAQIILNTVIEDNLNQWANNEFTVTEAGNHETNLNFRTSGITGSSLNKPKITIRVYKNGVQIDKETHIYLMTFSGSIYDGYYDEATNTYYHKDTPFVDWEDVQYSKIFNFDAGDINAKITFKVSLSKIIALWQDIGEVGYYTYDYVSQDFSIENKILKITNIDSAKINRFKKTIDLKDHVPSINISTFLKDLQKKTFTIFDYDDENKTILIRDISGILNSKKKVDYSGSVEENSKNVDHTTLNDAVTLNCSDTIDLENFDKLPDREKDFPAEALPEQIVRIKAFNSWFIYKEQPEGSLSPYKWEYHGSDSQERKYGDGTKNVFDFQFSIPVIPMSLFSTTSYIIPMLPDNGISKAYETDGEESGGYFALWKGADDNAATYHDFYYCTVTTYYYNKQNTGTYSLNLDWLYGNIYKKYFHWLMTRKYGVNYKAHFTTQQLKEFDKFQISEMFSEEFYINQLTATLKDGVIDVEFDLFLK